MPLLTGQYHIRFRNDDEDGTWMADQDVENITISVDIPFRVRIALGCTGFGSFDFQPANLYFAVNSDTVTRVTANSSPIQSTPSMFESDGASCVGEIDDGSGNIPDDNFIYAGTFDGDDGSADCNVDEMGHVGPISIPSGCFTEVEYCLVIPSAGVNHGDIIELNVYKGTTPLMEYAYIPIIEVDKPPTFKPWFKSRNHLLGGGFDV